MDEYEFKFDAYSPSTIPMSRLAEYMILLADLFGEKKSVHFSSVKEGSTVIAAKIDREARPKVRLRIEKARTAEIGDEDGLGKTVAEINKQLRLDNADGEITLGSAKILAFPGRKIAVPLEVGPFNKPTSIEGYLQRIGGRDETAHGQIEDFEGRIWPFEMKRSDAVQIARYLYETPLRLNGIGRWFRSEGEKWELKVFRVKEFDLITPKTLTESVAEIRSAVKGIDHGCTAIRLLQERGDGR